MTKQISELQ